MATNSTFTITFCDRAENHVGMQQIGTNVESGFDLRDLDVIRRKLLAKGITSDIYDLNLESENLGAYILLVKNFCQQIATDNLFAELSGLTWDSKARMYGRVVNKHARHNLCFDDGSQEPDYVNGRGRVVDFSSVPGLATIREVLTELTGQKFVAEGNYYFDVDKCGIGYHGDSERKMVVGIRSGASMSLVYQWYYKLQPVEDRMEFQLDDGDMYIMSEKATGNDWHKKNIYTLRHAAGCSKFTD